MMRKRVTYKNGAFKNDVFASHLIHQRLENMKYSAEE